MIATLALAAAATSCPVTDALKLIGAPYDAHTRAEAHRIVQDAPLRWIMPGSAIQQDWVPERLNLEIDEKGHVVKAWCG